MNQSEGSEKQIRTLELFLLFLKIGWLTLGGGYVMIPLFMEEFVKKRRWLDEREFLDVLTFAQLFPGPIALNFGVSLGYKLKGVKGAFLSALAVFLPSFVSILVIAIFFLKFQQNRYVQGLFYGLRPAIAGLMIYSVIDLISKEKLSFSRVFIIALFSFVLLFFKLNPAYLIFLAFGGSVLWVFTRG